MVETPAEIICHACSFLKFWTGLHKEEFQAQIRDGVDVLLSVACQMIANPRQDLPQAASSTYRRSLR